MANKTAEQYQLFSLGHHQCVQNNINNIRKHEFEDWELQVTT